jgi:hypothetical protein
MALDRATTPANVGACDNTLHSMASPLGVDHATAVWRQAPVGG